MSLAIRIIPILLRREGSLVKGARFDSWRSVGHPLQAAKIHASRAVDELIYLDIGATPKSKHPDLDMAKALTDSAFIPVTIGGGVSTMRDIEGLFQAGADKISICTNAVPLISQAAKRFGSQALVASVDVIGKKVVLKCGRQNLNKTPIQWAKKLEGHGAGEILLQDVERDGMQQGYNLKLIERVAKAVSIPVIAAGGCGTYQHMLDAVRAGASAVASGAMFQFTDATPKSAAKYLNDHGVPARWSS